MKSGTAIGLLVGGAVLLLATSRRSAPGAAAPVYPNAGGALNPLNWFGGAGSGAMIQPGQIFGPSADPAPMYQIPQAGGAGQKSSYGGGSPSYGGAASPSYGAGNGFQQVSYGGSPAYSPFAGYGSGAYAAGYSPLPVPNSQGGVAYDYFPVMTPGGGFQDYTQLAQGGNTYMAANTSAAPTPSYA